jgi:ornithine carbamoyltransferase
MAMKDLLRTADLSELDLHILMAFTKQAKRDPDRWSHVLNHRTVVLYFSKPSTRTRISSETAVVHLGGVPLTVGPNELQLGRGETIEDTARVLSSYASAIIIRTYADEDVRRMAATATVPVVNALTDGHHPLQSITDLFTLTEIFGRLRGRRLAFVGAGNNVTHSLLEACALMGMDIAVATPEGYAPDPEIVVDAEKLAATSGAQILIGHDPVAAVHGACAVYSDVWLSMGDPASTRAARLAALTPYRVTPELMAHAAADAVFLHCLPAHRGEEVAAEVIDGPRSRVFEQAANRLPVIQAVLHALLTGQLRGEAVLP